MFLRHRGAAALCAVLGSASLLAACGTAASAVPAHPTVAITPLTTSPTYGRDVAPIVARHCASCHSSPVPAGGYQMRSYDELFSSGPNAPNVVAGDANSPLLRRVRGETLPSGGQMPPSSLMSAEEIAVFVRWVETGALP
jgi:mono/diheme cytochrome c family protein